MAIGHRVQRLSNTLASFWPGSRIPPGMRRTRVERFGGVVQLARPPALVFLDRDYCRDLGLVPTGQRANAWADPEDDGNLGRRPLLAPLEAHLALTNHCTAGCAGCYTGATASPPGEEWQLEEWKRAVDELARMGVFHLALGGGESATLAWLGDLARHARTRGAIPNLTTSGLVGIDRLLPIADLFGQINVSIDGLGSTYTAMRGFDGFAAADIALRRLRAVKREVGINAVITRQSFAEIDRLFAYARARRASEIELLRFKPSGRGARRYRELRCTDAQHRALLPTVLAASRRHRVRARLDCSYTPMIAHARPQPRLLSALAIYGCAGGDFLVGASADGRATACSFAAPPADGPAIDELSEYWPRADAFDAFRHWRQADAPCSTCPYHALCRGGCRAVSLHTCGTLDAPDPECPRVVDFAGAR